jgi:cobalt/nickel transport system permease protein
MGVCSALAAYFLIYRPIVKKALTKKTITAASIAACVGGLQLGAFCVVLETFASGVTELPFAIFAALMQPIHLAIGLVEGIITAAVLCFIHSQEPAILEAGLAAPGVPATVRARKPSKKILVSFAALTVIVAGILAIFASSFPDGLEWSMEKTAGFAELERSGAVYETAGGVVEKTAFMPDYGFKAAEGTELSPVIETAGTSVAGIAGSVITVIVAGGAGLLISMARKKQAAPRGA